MDALLDSLKVVGDDHWLILAILLFIGWGTLIVFAILKRVEDEHLSDADRIALALAGWPAPLLLVSCIFLLLHNFVSPVVAVVGAGVLIAAGASVALLSISNRVRPDAALPVLVFLTLVFLRLGFVSKVTLPPYFDSAEHFRVIQSLLSGEGFRWPVASYYHLGYHIIASMLTSFSGAGINRVMVIFGQIILAAIPMPMYFLVRRATGSQSAAFVAWSAAAFGWSMPAHAVNWGKYPAILGLLMLQFTAGAVALRSRPLSAGAGLAAALIHTRAIVLMAILSSGWLLSRLWRPLLIAGMIIFLAVEIAMVRGDSALAPYREWATWLAMLLTILALKPFPRLVYASILVLIGVLAGMLIPIRSTLSLLDRPLVVMAFYLPLAFLSGLGASRLPKVINGALAIAIAVHAWMVFGFSPSACCRLAGPDDAAALDWVNREILEEAHFGIASADLSVTSSSAPLENAGTDAGIWVTPLTGRSTSRLPYFIDFNEPETYEQLCQEDLTHLYVGGTELSFKMRDWAAHPEWYKTIFSLPEAQIIQIVGCP